MRLRVVVLVAALGCAALSAPAGAHTPARWNQLGRVNSTRPSALACAGPSLCIAADTTGNVLSTTRPLSRHPVWRVAHVDPGTRLWGVSCPSHSLCVAVDDAGRVLTAAHPARGAAFWRSGTVRPGGLFSVSCPSAKLCVAVGGQDIAFSTNPRRGARSWTLVRGVDQSLPPECGADGPASACGPPDLLSVSCPSVSFCTASDSFGSRVRSTAPGTRAGWPRSGNAATGLVDGPISCLDRYRCLTVCAAGSGFFTSQCPGTAAGAGDIETLRSGKIGVSHHVVSPDEPVGLWCVSSSMCFAADAPGSLMGSRDPTNPAASWTTLIAAPHIRNDPRTIVGVACPGRSVCLALDSTGILDAGPAPPTYNTLRARLRAVAVAVTRGRVRTRTVTVRAPIAGRLSIVFHRPRQRTVLARASATFAQPGTAALRFTLTPAGHRAVARDPTVTFAAVFSPAHPEGVPPGRAVHILGRVRLRPR